LEITNRFDWDVKDKKEYFHLIQLLSEHERVQLVANNPFEGFHMKVVNNINFPRLRILRPVGISTFPAKVP
jgi:hypothetical protein